ncbi:MAG: hypothetical protein A2096_17880 [Spirochaetes bacterium GWF1_41_5]|nr:MAG: hypothetical protein A2096_17880 [Spirochaetes bacterium GWF1_41_5]
MKKNYYLICLVLLGLNYAQMPGGFGGGRGGGPGGGGGRGEGPGGGPGGGERPDGPPGERRENARKTASYILFDVTIEKINLRERNIIVKDKNDTRYELSFDLDIKIAPRYENDRDKTAFDIVDISEGDEIILFCDGKKAEQILVHTNYFQGNVESIDLSSGIIIISNEDTRKTFLLARHVQVKKKAKFLFISYRKKASIFNIVPGLKVSLLLHGRAAANIIY